MILGYRTYQNVGSRGLNIFLSKAWTLPMEEMGQLCFHAIDATLTKMETDSEATLVTSLGVDNPDLVMRKLETARRAGLNALPLRFRKGVSLWSLHIENRALFHDLPAWAMVYIETQGGDLMLLRTHSEQPWQKIPLGQEDSWIHVGLFSRAHQVQISKESKASRFLRLSTATESAQLLHPESISFPIPGGKAA